MDAQYRKVAIVTGGTRGIGYAIVERLVGDRFFVYFTYNRSEELANKIMEELGGDNTKGIKCPVEDFQKVKQVVSEIKEERGHIDLLVNNAGITKDNWFALMPIEDFKKVVEVNLMGYINFANVVIKTMIAQKSGVIINISSIAGIIGSNGQTNYSAAKGGIIAFTKSLAKEVGKYNIKVVAVAPGFIETEMFAKIPLNLRRKYIQNVALQRPGTPEEVANLVSFLASDKASYITGTVIRIDGGM